MFIVHIIFTLMIWLLCCWLVSTLLITLLQVYLCSDPGKVCLVSQPSPLSDWTRAQGLVLTISTGKIGQVREGGRINPTPLITSPPLLQGLPTGLFDTILWPWRWLHTYVSCSLGQSPLSLLHLLSIFSCVLSILRTWDSCSDTEIRDDNL